MTEQLETAAEWMLGGGVFCIGITVLLLLHVQFMSALTQFEGSGTENAVYAVSAGEER